MLLKANLKRHRGVLAGLFVLLAVVSLTLASTLAVWTGAGRYTEAEMDRLGFGTVTAWVSGVPDLEALSAELAAHEEVEAVGVQPLVFSDYTLREQESDSEGQLVAYDPSAYPYRFFTDDLSGYASAPDMISPGEVYVSPSLCSIYEAEIGDTVTFSIARNGGTADFTIAGFFEDPFMGSSMIGMKTFLISESDRAALAELAAGAGIDALAREGAMLHLFAREDSGLTTAQFSQRINGETSLPAYTEFVHSHDAILGFMLVLQNAFSGFLLAFAVVLLSVSFVVLGHSITSAIRQETRNLGILKTVGFTSRSLRWIQLAQYLLPILLGLGAGLLVSAWAAPLVCRMTLTTTGILVPAQLPIDLCAIVFLVLILLLAGFITLQTGRIAGISPLRAIYAEAEAVRHGAGTPLCKAGLSFWMALRQISAGKRQYVGACLVALLLVFFASLMGRMDAWLGPNGEGLMDAFNPADLDLAVQPVGEVTQAEIETVIQEYSAITDQYALAMPGVTVNGVDYTANVITEPERFHLLQGRACLQADEVVLTEFVAADLGAAIGDTVTVAAGGAGQEYTVSGIYQCANDMGANIGMSREGYARIGTETTDMWCVHYFLADEGQKDAVMAALDSTFGTAVYIHENSWPGLHGILSAMDLLIAAMYVVTALFILVVTALTASRLLAMERRDIGIYKSIGFTSGRLRLSFALRFGVAALTGSLGGTVLSALLTDPLAGAVLRLEGISNFSSHPGVLTVVLPGLIVVMLFAAFAYLLAGQIRKIPLSTLVAETT